jgi:hypothetical protein
LAGSLGTYAEEPPFSCLRVLQVTAKVRLGQGLPEIGLIPQARKNLDVG